MKPTILLLLTLTGLAQAMQTPPAKPLPTPQPAPSAIPLPAPIVFTPPVDTRLFTNAPDAGGVTLSPSDGKIEPYASFSITFPSDIVSPDKIDTEGAESPLVVWPPLEAEFYWRTPAQGDWIITGQRIPGQTYRVRLRGGLKALDGSALPIDTWGAELSTDPLKVSSWYDERSQLSARPQVPLEFNYPVRVHDLAEGLWFQNRATRQRFPAQVRIDSEEAGTSALPTPTTVRVTPRDPLPVGAFYDLVVENVADAFAGRTLPFPRVFALGTTRPLAIDFVAARNWATDSPHIEIKFTSGLDDAPLAPDAIRLEPAVPGFVTRKEGSRLIVQGPFDISQRYKVTISKTITGDRGYPMAADSVWGATFQAKPPTVLFPQGELRQRASTGLRFALIQANTGTLRWKLARIPAEKLAAVREASGKEFQKGDPLLTETFALETVGSGSFEATGQDKEELRKITFAPELPLAGPYLFEAEADRPDGGRIANRSLIWFSDTALTQKSDNRQLTIRLAEMASGQPVSRAVVQALTPDLMELADATSDAGGLVTFPQTIAAAAGYFSLKVNGTTTLWPASPDGQFASGSTYFSAASAVRGKILTDRPLYRPGQEVKFKGFLRTEKDNRLTVPSGSTVAWKVTKSWQDEVLATGTAKVSADGGWDGAWTVPDGADLGDFRVVGKLGTAEAGQPAFFRIEEFRNPPFSVTCEAVDTEKPARSVVQVSSRFFHGAPNVGSRVKWKATWISDHQGDYYYSEPYDGFQQVDLFSKSAKAPVYDVIAEGETALNGSGQTTLTSDAPFPDSGNRAHSTVLWQVDVTGPDGQTITGGATDEVAMNDRTLGVKAIDDRPEGTLKFELRTLARNESLPIPAKVPVELFLVQAKSVKEQVAPFVYRYRNFDDFIRLRAENAPANGILDFPAKEPGRYVLVAGPIEGSIAVSAEQIVTGPGESEFAMSNDESLQVIAPKEPVTLGSPAAFDVIAPSGGVAWVTVETDRILDSRTLDLPGNASRIEIPTREEFLPNAFATVYLLRPGAKDGIPGEMFGFAEFRTSDPARALSVEPSMAKPEFEPREKITGSVAVTSEGKPVAGAEVTVYAVDDSILELGGWSLPAIAPSFFPDRAFNVVTSPALRGLSAGVSQEQLTQKGYTVGDGGDEAFGNVGFTRKDFKPLLFWNPSLKTDADGRVTFETTAPDNLTRFRIIAFAQTAASQTGEASSTFAISKRLIVEPALPRFLRQGDQIDLRAVARQKFTGSDRLAIRCLSDLTLEGPDRIELAAAKNAPAVGVFSATTPSEATSAKIRFDVAGSEKSADSVEVTLPVLPKTIAVTESTAGQWTGGTFRAADFSPAPWKNSAGTFQATVSTSPWLAKLMGIPAVLDYPHGCLEQQSSRILVFTALADLLKSLPSDKEQKANYERSIRESLAAMEASLLPDGLLPYWPLGTSGNAFVTIQTALAVAIAQAQDIEVPERLAAELPTTLQSIVDRTLPVAPTVRAFALFVLTQIQDGADVALAADDLYLQRDKLTYEGRAFLAMAYAELGIAPEKQRQLVSEFPKEFPSDGFDPLTFSSAPRTEAICLLAGFTVDPASADPAIRARLSTLMESSSSLSTQENLWLLLTFNALRKSTPAVLLGKKIQPMPDATSADKSAAAWSRPLAALPDLTIAGLAAKGTFVLQARRQLGANEISPVENGLRIDRFVRNLTDAARDGSAGAPFQLGDEILITYRFESGKPQSFVALEDALPAAFEILNPNLDLFGKAYSIPAEPGVTTASLSHSEIRDSRTCLYFDSLPAGLNSYAVLARVTAAGAFEWPATQISPMYDSRTYGRTAPARVIVRAP